MRRSFFLASLAIACAPVVIAANGCFWFDGLPGGNDCDCPLDLGQCESAYCEDDECIISYQWGIPAELQTSGDCKALVCFTTQDPEEVYDPEDTGDDYNDCTVETCTPDGPVQDRLPFGSFCGSDGVCAAEVLCISCQGQPCWNVDCGQEPPIIEKVAPGTSCGENLFCDALANCRECDDGSSCTTEDCSSGEVVVVEQLPYGAACENGGYCGAGGNCISCDDGNECTEDDCTNGVVNHVAKPFGTTCGSNDICENGSCINWCTPLPDPVTCPDNDPYEPSNNEWTGDPHYLDDDDAPKPVCGVLGAGDTDWLSYYAEDRAFENDVNDFQFWSFGKTLRFCAYAECDAPENTLAPCYDGGIPTMSPTGFPGCCWQGVFDSLSYISMNLDCTNSEYDEGWVRIRIDNPFDEECAPYGLLDYGY